MKADGLMGLLREHGDWGSLKGNLLNTSSPRPYLLALSDRLTTLEVLRDAGSSVADRRAPCEAALDVGVASNPAEVARRGGRSAGLLLLGEGVVLAGGEGGCWQLVWELLARQLATTAWRNTIDSRRQNNLDMGTPSPVVGFLRWLLEVHHAALVLTCFAAFLPRDCCAFGYRLALTNRDRLLHTGGCLLLALTVHLLKLVVPNLGGFAVTVVDLDRVRVRLQGAVLPSQLLAIDIFPEGGFRDPHFLTRVLLLVDTLRLHFHLGDCDRAGGAVLLVEELPHHLVVPGRHRVLGGVALGVPD